MVLKLKSILRPIPWSLAIRAFAIAGSWLLLPFPVFLVFAFYFYFFPLFQATRFIIPFLLALTLAWLFPLEFLYAFLIGLIFFILLGIKDLIFIRREEAYQILVFFLSLLLFLEFFNGFENWGPKTIFVSPLLGILFFFLFRGFLEYGTNDPSKKHIVLFAVLASFLVWQMSLALLFLPFTPFNQAAALFLISAILVELIFSHLNARLTHRNIFVNLIGFLVLLFVIFASTEWRL